MEVVVSNPRKVRAIYQHERKCDQRDALMLARIGRMDRALLYPVHHCSEQVEAGPVAHQIARQLGASTSGVDQFGALQFEELGLRGAQSFQRTLSQGGDGDFT